MHAFDNQSQYFQTDKTNSASRTLLDKQALFDIVDGSALLATGGGGPKSMGHNIIDTMDFNQPVEMVPLNQVSDDKWVVVSVFMGSPEAAKRLDKVCYNSPILAVQQLQQHSGISADYIMPLEIGAVNSIAPIKTASSLGIPVIDADGAGRAVPVLSCITFGTDDELLDKGLVLVNETDDVSKQQSAHINVKQIDAAEELASGIVTTVSFGALGGLAMWMVQSKKLKPLAIEGGLSRSRAIGQMLRQVANVPTTNYAALTVKTLQECGYKAKLLGHSLRTMALEATTVAALDHGKLTLKTQDNQRITIYIVNEYMYAYHSNSSQPLIMSPDLLCCLLEDGSTMDNSELRQRISDLPPGESLVLSLIGIEAPEKIKENTKVCTAFLNILEKIGYAGPYQALKASA